MGAKLINYNPGLNVPHTSVQFQCRADSVLKLCGAKLSTTTLLSMYLTSLASSMVMHMYLSNSGCVQGKEDILIQQKHGLLH